MKPAEEILKEYESKLVRTLPIDDVVFNCMLNVHEVFTEDELTTIQSQPTPSDKTKKLLHYIIDMLKCANPKVYNCLQEFLIVMEDYEAQNYDMKSVAREMRDELKICKWLKS